MLSWSDPSLSPFSKVERKDQELFDVLLSDPTIREMYLRRHWFRLRTTSGEQMTLYCERQAKNTRRPKARWWLYKINA